MLMQSEIALLEQSGITVDAVEALHGDEATGNEGATAAITTGFVSAYLDSPGIDAAFAQLHTSFPALTSLTDLPETTTGYDGSAGGLAGPSPVRMLRITTTPAVFSKPGFLIVAGLHAREWAPPLAAIEFASQLLNNYDPASADPDVIAVNTLVESLDILIVGAGNPDGIDYSHHDDAMWRKNRRPNGGAPACPGVDNNRNFSIYWGEGGSSPNPCDYQVYRGPSAFSEAEDRNLRFIVEQFPNVLAAIDCHSFGEKFLRPQPTGGSFIASEPVPAADHDIYSTLEASMNSAVAGVTAGKSYLTGTTSNHAGTFDEYMYFGHRIFAFELEIGEDFQPPIADALVSVQEAAAVMRAVATETLNLSARFITPTAVIQVVDKSGSMVSSGYVDATRWNAERIVDLLSLNDYAGIVSFNGSAATDLPLTPIFGAGDYAAARAAVAAIPFAGSTSIGAGIQQALSLAPPLGVRRAILLLSDGYENTAPMVDTVLPSVPEGTSIYTIALGFASDQVLLQHVATVTGGMYFFSPNELDLFRVYNYARGALADVDMVLDDQLSFGAGDSSSPPRHASRTIVIDCDVDYADFSVAAHQADVQIETTLRCLSVPSADLHRLERKTGIGYVVMRLKRPQPGIYELTVSPSSVRPVTCSVAAYVKSPLRLHLTTIRDPILPGRPIDLHLSVLDNGKPLQSLSISAEVRTPATSIQMLAKQWKKDMGLRSDAADRIGETLARAVAVRDHVRISTGQDPAKYFVQRVHLVHPMLARAPKTSMAVRTPTSRAVDGTYNVRVAVQGRTLSGCPFVRIASRSVRVG
jgi:hypothetical protein